MISPFKILTIIASTLILNTAFAAADENYLPYLPGLLNQKQMIAPAKSADGKSTTYILPATPSTSQWGVFDSAEAPVLTIKSGDTVAIETLPASDNQVVPGATIEQILKIQGAVADRGPHTLTGPIYVEGAEPGDILRIHLNKVLPRSYASNNSAPGKGLFPNEFKESYVKYFYLDVKKMQMQFAPGIVVPLRPFPGIIAVAREIPGKYNSDAPGIYGGNMDLRELIEGTTLYLPVFMKGGLVWTGDSHAGQGNGEIDLTAIETAFQELNVTIDVIKQKPLTWPRIETPSAWISVGYDTDLNKAFDILQTETIKLIAEQRKVSNEQAKKIMLATWNCPIAEVVNGVKGVYCMVPKAANARAFALPKSDNASMFVTYAKDVDLEKAMSMASMDMLNKIVSAKNISRVDAYTLASFTMDCRIAPYHAPNKEVHCMMAKNLWVSQK